MPLESCTGAEVKAGQFVIYKASDRNKRLYFAYVLEVTQTQRDAETVFAVKTNAVPLEHLMPKNPANAVRNQKFLDSAAKPSRLLIRPGKWSMQTDRIIPAPEALIEKFGHLITAL